MGGLRPSGFHLNKPVVFGLLGVALLVFIVSRLYIGGGLTAGTGFSLTAGQGSVVKSVAAGRGMDGVVNITKLEAVPALIAPENLEKKEEEFQVGLGDKTIAIHVVQMKSSKADLSKALTVLFLHGARFTSQNWMDIKTMEYVASWGHRAFAIDLPGFGKSKTDIDVSKHAEFLSAFTSKMAMTNVVIVSPSMSGSYSLPYLFLEPDTSTKRAVGFIPVAPVDTDKYREQYKKSQVQTLIVYGTKDEQGSTTKLDNLKLLPEHEVAPIVGAGHACYLDNPDAFHKVLFYFLKKLTP